MIRLTTIGMIAMGFSDSFKKLEKNIGSKGAIDTAKVLTSGADSKTKFGALHGRFGTDLLSQGLQSTQRRTSGDKYKYGREATFATNPGFATGVIAQDERQTGLKFDKAKQFFNPEDESPPAVGEKPGQGAGNIAAKQEARRRAIASARGRRGFASTVGTTPLGLTGDSTVGKKRLIGE